MIKVVIVEDEELIRQGLKLTMNWEKLGCQVIGEAADGEEGAGLIKKLQPDIVLTDIRMPKMSGLEMMEALREESHARFIILSGYDEFSYAKKAITLGANGYLLKPIDDDEFEEAILHTIMSIKDSQSHINDESSVEKQQLIKESFQDKYIAKACTIMRNRLKEELTLKMVADELAISESYLGKLFKSKTDYTFLDVLTLYRIKVAVDMLENTDKKIYEIAYEVGYNDSKYFSKVFQKKTGVKPTEYRNGYHIAPSDILNALK